MMGAAAWNRGSRCIAEQIRLEVDPSREAMDIESINAAAPGAMRLLGDTVARPGTGAVGAWWLMNRREGGWRALGIPFKSLRAIRRYARVEIGELSRDEYGPYRVVRVISAPLDTAPESC